MVPASRVQGEFIALTNVSKSVYYALKNHGVAYVKKFQSIQDNQYKQFKGMVKEWKYARLFTTFSADGMKKFKGTSPNRWMINEPSRMHAVASWNNMEGKLVELFTENKFPHAMFDFSLNYSLLKSDPNLDCAQQTHCDQASPFSYGTDKLFTFSAIMGIEKESYLDVCTKGKIEPQRVLIERGDVLFVRNDIPHRGCENLTDYTNHRIHILIIPANMKTNSGTKSVPMNDFGPCPKWGDVSQIFITPFK